MASGSLAGGSTPGASARRQHIGETIGQRLTSTHSHTSPLNVREVEWVADRLAELVVDHVVVQVITASRSEWSVPFTGLQPGQFRKLVAVVAQRGGQEIADGRRGRPWNLQLRDRVLLVTTYWRTNLTMRKIGPLFGVSHSAAHRIIDREWPSARNGQRRTHRFG